MAIDLATEKPIPLKQATKHPLFKAKSMNGRAVDFSTVWRWALKGVRGVKLETVRIGGTLCTSTPAIERWIERLSTPGATSETITSSQAKRAHRTAAAELAAAGI